LSTIWLAQQGVTAPSLTSRGLNRYPGADRASARRRAQPGELSGRRGAS
jgi:hypothetical protein